jgi:hypothetical protein
MIKKLRKDDENCLARIKNLKKEIEIEKKYQKEYIINK